MSSTPERMQLAGEVIRFFEERFPPGRRERVSWAVTIHDLDDPAGPQAVSAFSDPKQLAGFLAQFALLADRRSEEGSIPTPTAPGAS